MHPLRTPDCGWSLLDGSKDDEKKPCCLRHASATKISESWFSDKKFDPNSEGESPFNVDIFSPAFDKLRAA